MAPWQIILLLAAGFVAVTTLVRLMAARRDTLVAELQRQAEAEARLKKQQAAEKKSAARRAAG